MAAGYKLQEQHHVFITTMVASFICSPKEITKRLRSKKWAAEYGYEPVSVRPETVRAVIRNLDPLVIGRHQAQFLNDLTQLPFAHKKNRLIELSRLYDQVDKLTHLVRIQSSDTADEGTKDDPGFKELPLSGSAKLEKKLKILAQIRQECGEDVTKLADAIGSLDLNFILLQFGSQSMPASEARRIDANLGAIFGANGNGTGRRPQWAGEGSLPKAGLPSDN